MDREGTGINRGGRPDRQSPDVGEWKQVAELSDTELRTAFDYQAFTVPSQNERVGLALDQSDEAALDEVIGELKKRDLWDDVTKRPKVAK